MPSTHRGSCHCEQVSVHLITDRALADLPVRQCGCSFCLRHNPRYTSDPGGRVVIECQRPLLRYRFGHGSADFAMCDRCGVFAAALWHHEDQLYAVINLLVLDERAGFSGDARLMDFDNESRAQRTARRSVSWTPAELIAAAS